MPQVSWCLAQCHWEQSNPRLTQTPASSRPLTSASLPACRHHPDPSPAQTQSRCQQAKSMKALSRPLTCTKTKQCQLSKSMKALSRTNTCTKTKQCQLSKSMKALSRTHICTKTKQVSTDDLRKSRGLHSVSAYRHGLYIQVHACGCSAVTLLLGVHWARGQDDGYP